MAHEGYEVVDSELLVFEPFPDPSKRKILWNNRARLYDFFRVARGCAGE